MQWKWSKAPSWTSLTPRKILSYNSSTSIYLKNLKLKIRDSPTPMWQFCPWLGSYGSIGQKTEGNRRNRLDVHRLRCLLTTFLWHKPISPPFWKNYWILASTFFSEYIFHFMTYGRDLPLFPRNRLNDWRRERMYGYFARTYRRKRAEHYYAS